MNSEKKENSRKEILEIMVSVKKDLQELKDRIKPFVSEKAYGRTGTSDAMQKKSLQEGRVEALESRLRELQQSLDSIDTPGYGICSCCGGPIGEERQNALPETDKCVRCAQ